VEGVTLKVYSEHKTVLETKSFGAVKGAWDPKRKITQTLTTLLD